MLRSVALSDYMLTDPVALGPDDSVYNAIHQILVHRISGVCVVDEKRQLLGVLSEMDCMKAILTASYNDNPSAVGSIADFMTTEVVTANPNDDIVRVAADMLAKKHRRRPVTLDGRLVGQITCRQILAAVKDFYSPHDPSEWR